MLAGQSSTLVEARRIDAGRAALPFTTIAGVTVAKAALQRFEGLNASSPATALTTLDVSFGRLSKPQFDALHAEFGAKSRVPYSATRAYAVVDFLPPEMQALVNRDVDSAAKVTLPGSGASRSGMMENTDFTLSVSPNCHGTAWEMVRAYQGSGRGSVSLYFGDAPTLKPVLEDPSRFATVATAGVADLSKVDLKTLRPGDIVNVYENDYTLLHSAVYAGGGLFFEKPNTESDEYDETPYRLTTLADVVDPVTSFAEGEVSVVVRRPKRALEAPEALLRFREPALDGWLKKHGARAGKALVIETEVGLGGVARGQHASVVDVKSVVVGADGRGTVR